jgi:lysophospholipase L1-like esterase
MQFGHNDVAGKGPDRETDPATTYRENMIRYVEETIAAGATPVLVTSIVRRNFNPDGKFHPDSLALYAEEIRKIAAEKHVLLIDLYAQTLAQTNALGKAGSDKLGRILADGRIDTTHLGPLGQQAIGVMAARSLAKIDSRIRPFFHEIVPGGD